MEIQENRPQRRRSERVAKSLPIVVRGIDLLGQPFEERTATLNFNLHGCRYASRYHLPKNAWVTLEVPCGSEFENARARVAWIQRPPSVREFFQISVELETPQNIWRFEPTPQDWEASAKISLADEAPVSGPDSQPSASRGANLESQANVLCASDSGLPGEPMKDETNVASAVSAPSASGSQEPASPAGAPAEEISLSNESASEFRPGPGAPEASAASEEPRAEAPGGKQWVSEELFANWKQQFESLQQEARERLAADMHAAHDQWDELLQGSLDGGVRRIAEQLSERANQLRKPLLEALGEAENTAAALKAELAGELSRARSSMAEIERSGTQVSGLLGRIEPATTGALDEFDRRLELILDAQTREMGERAEALTSDTLAKAAAELDRVARKTAEAVAAEIESRLAPDFSRASELLREFSVKEVEAEESLRLHRERLRQISEASRRECLAEFEAAADSALRDFESARQTAAAKWAGEIAAGEAVVTRAATEAAEKTAAGLEEQVRVRLQSVADSVLERGTLALEERTAGAVQKFARELDARSLECMTRTREQFDSLANETAGRSRTQIEQAAESAAGAFGQVLRELVDQEAERFSASAAKVGEAQQHELEDSASQLLRKFETGAESSFARLHQQAAAQVETHISEARSAFADEFNSSLASFRAERETHEKQWAENLERMSAEAAAHHRERLDTTCDTWVVSSVRRLNEHGDHMIEALMRSADQAVRESCAKLFEGLAEILRERSRALGHAAHSAAAGHEAAERAVAAPPPESEPGLSQVSL